MTLDLERLVALRAELKRLFDERNLPVAQPGDLMLRVLCELSATLPAIREQLAALETLRGMRPVIETMLRLVVHELGGKGSQDESDLRDILSALSAAKGEEAGR